MKKNAVKMSHRRAALILNALWLFSNRQLDRRWNFFCKIIHSKILWFFEWTLPYVWRAHRWIYIKNIQLGQTLQPPTAYRIINKQQQKLTPKITIPGCLKHEQRTLQIDQWNYTELCRTLQVDQWKCTSRTWQCLIFSSLLRTHGNSKPVWCSPLTFQNFYSKINCGNIVRIILLWQSITRLKYGVVSLSRHGHPSITQIFSCCRKRFNVSR